MRSLCELPEALRRFTAEHPRVTLSLQESTTDQMLADLDSGALDIGCIFASPMLPATLAYQATNRDPLIVALPAATDDGRHTRIVSRFNNGLVALPRHTADYVVTEHGMAELRGRDLRGRAEALIAIAAPAFRDTLAAEWDAILRRL